MPRGGRREGAGRDSSWGTGATKVLRVPAALEETVMICARTLDAEAATPGRWRAGVADTPLVVPAPLAERVMAFAREIDAEAPPISARTPLRAIPPPAALAPRKATRGQPRKPTRPQRLAGVAEELRELAGGYEAWLDAVPANLAEGELAGRLRDTIQRLVEALDAVEQVEPPRVGR